MTGQKDVVIVTGQSGIKVEECINRMVPDGLESSIFQLDKRMLRESDEESFVYLLSKPPKAQEVLWQNAFNKINDDLPKTPKVDKLHFLTFHACYYHQQKSEFVSPIDFNVLSKLKDRTKMVITLIDDCYDIYRRLMGNNQMYADVREETKERTPFNAISESIKNIMRIIAWRETEIAFSRKIASLLGVEFFVIAVKHPAFMVKRLLTNNLKDSKILYLSHPISGIRKTSAYARDSEFLSELASFSKRMLKIENIVLFIPDTIDEYRIEKSKDGNFYLPEVKRGWLLPYQDQWLFESLPEELENINPLNPLNHNLGSDTAEHKSAVSSALKILESIIREQVNARDRTLVEQSKDGVIVYRPYWEPVASSGIEDELEHNKDLRDNYQEQQRGTYIINTFEDKGKWRINYLFLLLEAKTDLTEEKLPGKTASLREKWKKNHQLVMQFNDNSINRTQIRNEIEESLDSKYRFVQNSERRRGALSSLDMYTTTHQKDSNWEELFESISQRPISKYADKEYYLYCPNSELETKLDSYLIEHFQAT